MKIALCLGGMMLGLTTTCYADAQAIALNCMNCHENDGLITSDIPSLEALTEAELRQALLDFKHDKRVATLMPRIVKAYSDKELSAVAAYLTKRR